MATRINPDWKPSTALREWAKKEGYQDEAVNHETEAFIDYWVSTPGSKGTKDDWDATWRNWIRRGLGRSRKAEAVLEPRQGGRWSRIKRPWVEAKHEYLERHTRVNSLGQYVIDKQAAFKAYMRDVENRENGVSE